MHSEDYLKKQIDQFTQALVSLLSRSRLRSSAVEELTEDVNHHLATLSLRDLEKLCSLNNKELKSELDCLDAKAMHSLAEMVFELSQPNSIYRGLALNLVDLTNELAGSISLTRLGWKNALNDA